ncbi:DUF4376 domain-containing protein [Oleomonas cavernae]|uniref:DUF4376 domain-containing protein n=2 Tax=Oleomonas cavernae TaxID=2320859 RepID=A0A418WU51_9PROT|nr:DUF4376 domain-containing protein [Oleomonas cavernae]
MPAALAPFEVAGADIEPVPAGGLTPPPALQAYRLALRAEVDVIRDSHIAAGVPVDLGGGLVFTVDTRNDTDFRNILGLTTFALLAITAQAENVLIPFRAADDLTRLLTPEQVIGLSQAVTMRVAALYAVAWEGKAAIDAADTHTALDLLDLDAGWPT